MNKKVLTLCAGLLLAGSATAWGQVVIIGGTTTASNGAYTYQKSTYGLFDTFVREDASMRDKANYPKVSPFAIQTKYGAKPISELQHVDGQSDGRYFQFVVGTSYNTNGNKLTDNSGNGSGTEILTMVWVDTKGELQNNGSVVDGTVNGGTPVDGHYEIQIENVNNANVSTNPIRLDRTLWKVTANRVGGTGTTLYYELQNKASKMLLQLSAGAQDIIDEDGDGNAEVKLNISNGETKWRWAQGEIAALESNIENETDNKVLQATLSAQPDNQTTIHLARKVVKKGSTVKSITLGAIRMNSNAPFTTVTIPNYLGDSNLTATFTPIVFEAWEANPIVLTAAQINAELGNEDEAATNAEKTSGYFHFEFDNDVQGDVNVMTASDFIAEAAKVEDTYGAYNRLPGDAPDGYVRFLKRGSNAEYLHVDTAYYDASGNDQYALKMAVSQILYPRDAVLADGLKIGSNGELTFSNGTPLDNEQIYTKTVDTDGDGTADAYAAPNAAPAYVQLKRQSNFRPIFYPSTQSLRLQAEMMYRTNKNEKAPWWKQMVEDAVYNESKPDASGTGDCMRIAEYAADQDVNASAGENMRGYYPSYTQYIDYTETDQRDRYKQGLRLIHYANAWKKTDLTDPAARNGYGPQGSWDWTRQSGPTADKMLWNAVGNVLLSTANATEASDWTDSSLDLLDDNVNVWVKDPAATATSTVNGLFYVDGPDVTSRTPNEVEGTAVDNCPLWTSPFFALAHSNVVGIRTLTTGHRVLTTDVHDLSDLEYNGLNTYITLKSIKTEGTMEEVAEIPEGYYYIRNANTKNADLVKIDDYRYEDLAATNATFAYWNSNTQEWDRGVSAGDASRPSALNSANPGISDRHDADKANVGNLVYSTDKKVIPSAQWYIKGNGGYYTIINRESGREWGTSHWWKTDEPGVYVNLATYTDGSSLNQSYRDTIRIEAVPSSELTNPYMGYLYITPEEIKADTVNYNVGMTMAEATFTLTEDENGLLKLSQAEGATGDYKLERVFFMDKDNASQEEIPTDEFIYGYVRPDASDENEVDTTQMLKRAKYYIYKDDVSANTGSEETSIRTRKYITLDGGKYKLTSVKVKLNANGSSDNMDVEEILTPNSPNARRAFYIKQMSTVEPNQFVLVDPNVVTQTTNGTSTKTAYGARLFANQLTAEIQPSSLISDGASNAYAASIFNIDKKQAYNYVDIRPAGVARDTVEFYSTKTDGQYLLSENADGLLESLDARLNKNNALFLDTANVAYPECPRFLIGLRSKDSVEISNLDNHNHHLFTDADYLINMVDSAATNSAYVYKNQAFNNTDCYRLGFVRARHYADGTLKFLNEEGRVFDLKALGEDNLNIATYAFRYANADRNPNEFYIETMYNHTTKGWLATINHVLVVTPNIQEAEVFSVNTENITDAPTANEVITAEGAVSVVATDGAVVIKGAEGKNVVIATILGKVVANETVNSDNETIAVPAGIAVVSVDGESFKVVVK